MSMPCSRQMQVPHVALFNAGPEQSCPFHDISHSPHQIGCSALAAQYRTRLTVNVYHT